MSYRFILGSLEHIFTIIKTQSNFSFFVFPIGPYGAMYKFQTPCTGGLLWLDTNFFDIHDITQS